MSPVLLYCQPNDNSERGITMNPLEGVKILDLTQFFSGPFCTRILSDLGAEVIKFENPPYGDSRFTAQVKDNASAIYTSRNRGKKSVVMNLKDDRQRELFLKMVEEADAVISNYKAGNMDRLGLSYEVLKARNPKIVDVLISGFGQTGPWHDRAAFDGVVQAASGVISITGEKGGQPVKAGFSLADAQAGMFGAIATLAALYSAKETGVGRVVDVSMLDGLFAMEETLVANYFVTGKVPEPRGNQHTTATAFGSYTFKDGEQLFIACGSDNTYIGLCNALGHPELIDDERFNSMARRTYNRDALEDILTGYFKQYTAQEFADLMLAHHLPFGPIYNIKQISESNIMAARDMVVTAKYPSGQEFKVTGNPIKMSGMESKTEFYAAPLGNDTFDILSKYADLDTLHEIFDPVLADCEAKCADKYEKSKI